MLKFSVSTGCLIVVTFSFLFFSQTVLASPEIIGAPKCKSCHKAKTGDQWKIWTESAHARAFETLASEQARKIASDEGLGDPQTEEACLKCHATLASLGEGIVINEKGKYADSEGVGCESCHGPGSDYKSRKVMVDSEASIAAGLVMDGTADGCTNCHNEQSPTFKGFDFEQRWAEIAHPVGAASRRDSDEMGGPQGQIANPVGAASRRDSDEMGGSQEQIANPVGAASRRDSDEMGGSQEQIANPVGAASRRDSDEMGGSQGQIANPVGAASRRDSDEMGGSQEQIAAGRRSHKGVASTGMQLPQTITFTSSVGDVHFSHEVHAGELEIECADCHHQIHAVELDTPHPDYLTASWITCQNCHNTDSENNGQYYKCSDCHHSELTNIADETLSAKVVVHKSCWQCHESGTGVQASEGCGICHLKEEK